MRNQDDGARARTPSTSYAWWSVSALSFLAVLDYADRALIGAVAGPIKEEFGLTDTQLGILMGTAFVVSRMLFSAPIGRLADIFNRRNIIAISAVVLSIANVGFGLARSFLHLFLARAVFGATTAGTAIPTMSMIADLFPLRTRGLAMSVWHFGGTIGWAAGAAIAAIATQKYGWRPTIIAFGVLGAIIAIAFFLTVREPVRRDSVGNEVEEAPAPPLADVARFAFRQRSLLHTAAGFCILNAADLMLANWGTPFFTRTHDMELGAAGTAVGFALAVGGIPGVLLGGFLFDRLGRRNLRWHSWLSFSSAVATIPLAFIMYLNPSPAISVAAMTATALALALTYAAGTTIPMGLVGTRMRAVLYAVYSIVTYAGWALGPFVAGYLSTRLGPALGQNSLRYALLASAILFAFWAAMHFLLAARTINEDYQRASRH